VVINLLTNRAVLRSNLGNSTAMYQVSAGGWVNALWLIVIGASPSLVVGAVVGALALVWRARQTARGGAALCPGVERGRAAHLLLAAPAMLVTVQFFVLATGKPPEYARFALLIDVFLLVTAVAAIAQLRSTRSKHILAMALLAFTLPFALPYVGAFVRDASPNTSRWTAAGMLRTISQQGASTIAVEVEPAPYCMPPVDLFAKPLVLTPPVAQNWPGDLVVRVNPAGSCAPISWADTRFSVFKPRVIGQALLHNSVGAEPQPARAADSFPRRSATTAVSSPP
jgi:hypothetical protein